MSREFTIGDSDAVYALAQRPTPLGEVVKHAIAVIDQALADYGLNHLALSFNGGKDCTVLVHLLAASVFRHLHHSATTSPVTAKISSNSASITPSTSTLPASIRIPGVYVQCESPFTEVEEFTALCEKRYHLDLVPIRGGMKEALGEYLKIKAKEGEDKTIKAILVGTRRGDPHGGLLKPFTMTDPGWPQFMRVHPVLDWTYAQIWEFLREPTLTLGGIAPQEWCSLYDLGYTSLGSTYNTFPNPMLRRTDQEAKSGGGSWRPAWELEDESQERAGRGVKPKEPIGSIVDGQA